MKHFYLNKTGLDTLWSKIMANLGNAANYLKDELTKLGNNLTAAINQEIKDREEADKQLKADLTKDASDKYLPLKGGGTIVYPGDNPTDYWQKTTAAVGYDGIAVNNNSRNFSRASAYYKLNEVTLTEIYDVSTNSYYGFAANARNLTLTFEEGQRSDRVQILNNSIFFSNGITIEGYTYEPTNSSVLTKHPRIRVSGMCETNDYVEIGEYGIKSFNGQLNQLFDRNGSYKTIGIDIAPLVDSKVPLENLPPLDYVPNNKASVIRTGQAIYKITNDRLFITEDENASFGSTSNYIDISVPDANTGNGSITVSNRIKNDSGGYTSYSRMSADTINLKFENTSGSADCFINSGRLSLTTYLTPNNTNMPFNSINLVTDSTALIQLNDSNSNVGKYYATGVDFNKANYIVGANKDFYALDGANGVPRLDSNAKIKMSSLPADVGNVIDVRVNGSSVISNKIANIDLSSYAAKSSIPTSVSQLSNDSGYATTSWTQSNFASSNHSHSYLPLSGGTITGSLHVNGNIESSNDIIAFTSSDARLKENIHEENWLELINSLGGIYSFTYKRTKKDSVGLIAQNLLKSKFADIVTKDDDGYYKVNYMSSKLVSLALGGVSQVGDEVKELKQEIAELKEIVKQLKSEKQ